MPGTLPYFSASKPEFTAATAGAAGKINIGLEKMLLDDLKDSTNLQIRHELRMLRQILEAEKRKLRSLPPHPTGSVVRARHARRAAFVLPGLVPDVHRA